MRKIQRGKIAAVLSILTGLTVVGGSQQLIPTRWTLGSIVPPYNAQWSPDSRLVYSLQRRIGGGYSLLKVWDMMRGGALVAVRRYNFEAIQLSVSPDGALLAIVGGSTEQARVAFVNTQTLQTEWQMHAFGFGEVSWSPDGRRVAVNVQDSSLGRAVEVWDVMTHQRVVRWTDVYGARYFNHPDRLFLLDTNRIGVREISTGRWVWQHTFGGETSMVPELNALSPSGNLCAVFISGANETGIRLYRLSDGTLMHSIAQQTFLPYSEFLLFSPDGQRLVHGYVLFPQNYRLRVWRVEPLTRERDVDFQNFIVDGARFAPDGARLMIWGREQRGGGSYSVPPQVLETEQWTPLPNYFVGHFAPVFALAYGGNALYSINYKSLIRQNPATGAIEAITPLPAYMRDARFSKDGSLVITMEDTRSSNDYTVRIVRSRDGQVVAGGMPGIYDPARIGLSFDNRLLAVGSLIYRVENGQFLRGIPITNLLALDFSRDGRLIAARRASSNMIEIVQVAPEAGTPTLFAAVNTVFGVLALETSADGRWLALALFDGSVYVWDLTTGALKTQVATMLLPTAFALSPDGTLMALADAMHRVLVWRIADGVLVGMHPATTLWVTKLAFAPRAPYLAYTDMDGTLTGCEHPFYQPGDVNRDGCVDDSDLLAVLFAFGQSGSLLEADLNQDSVVDDADLLEVLFHFGSGCRR